MPKLVASFLAKLTLKNQSYVYLYATCGGSTGQLGNKVKAALAERGILLNAQFSVVMADTSNTALFDLSNKDKVDALNQKVFEKIQSDIQLIGECSSVVDMKGVKPKLFCYLTQKLYNVCRKTLVGPISAKRIYGPLCAAIASQYAAPRLGVLGNARRRMPRRRMVIYSTRYNTIANLRIYFI